MLAEDHECEPPTFDSEYANQIVAAVEGYHHALRSEQKKSQMLDELLTRLHEGKHTEQLLDFIFANFSSFIPFDRIGLAFLDEEKPFMAEAVYMRLRDGQPKLAPGYRVDIRHSTLYAVLQSGQPRIISDLGTYLAEHPTSGSTRLLLEEGMRSSLTVPLHALGRAVGFLFFSSRSVNAYDNNHAQLLLRIGRKIAMAIEKTRIIEMLEASNAHIRLISDMVFHDVRTPLSVIGGYLEMLKEGTFGALTDEQHQALEKMKVAYQHTQDLLDDLLDTALAQAQSLELKKEEFSLPALVDECLEGQRSRSLSRHLQFDVTADPRMPFLTADRQRLGRVFDNLLNNAIKYAPAGSTVFITLTRRESDFLVGIRDSGPGLSEEQKAKVFQRFPQISTTSLRGPGRSVGLGLSIAKDFVVAHGGHIWVDSAPGAGATFWFTIPDSSGAAQ
jgi:signal transduction histidine kinase